MPRSIQSVKPAQGNWARAAELQGRPMLITGASIEPAPKGWQESEVCKLSYTLLDYSGPDDIPEHGTVTLGVGGREWIVDGFAQDDEPLGPCTLVSIPLEGGKSFWSLEDYVETPVTAAANTKRAARKGDVPFR